MYGRPHSLRYMVLFSALSEFLRWITTLVYISHHFNLDLTQQNFTHLAACCAISPSHLLFNHNIVYHKCFDLQVKDGFRPLDSSRHDRSIIVCTSHIQITTWCVGDFRELCWLVLLTNKTDASLLICLLSNKHSTQIIIDYYQTVLLSLDSHSNRANEHL